MQLLVLVVLYHHAVRKMVLQPTVLPVSAGQLNVLLLVPIVTNLLVFVVLYHYAVRKMVLHPTLLPVSVGQLNVLLLVLIALNLPIPVHHVLLQHVLENLVQ